MHAKNVASRLKPTMLWTILIEQRIQQILMINLKTFTTFLASTNKVTTRA